MIDEIIDTINGALSGIHKDEVLFGITKSVYRTTDDETIEYFPGYVKNDGEVSLIDIDDINSIIIYHKAKTAALTNPVRSGYGDGLTSDDTLSFSMVSVWDTRKIKIQPIDLLLLLKSRMPQGITGVNGIDLIQITTLNAALASKQIFDSEFSLRGKYLLPEYVNLIEINYNIRLKYDQHCIEKCINCSN